MTLYTIIPEAFVYPQELEPITNMHLMNVGGIPVIAQQHDLYSLRINRIISTDPAHYLVKSVQPGSVLSAIENTPS